MIDFRAHALLVASLHSTNACLPNCKLFGSAAMPLDLLGLVVDRNMDKQKKNMRDLTCVYIGYHLRLNFNIIMSFFYAFYLFFVRMFWVGTPID